MSTVTGFTLDVDGPPEHVVRIWKAVEDVLSEMQIENTPPPVAIGQGGQAGFRYLHPTPPVRLNCDFRYQQPETRDPWEVLGVRARVSRPRRTVSV